MPKRPVPVCPAFLGSTVGCPFCCMYVASNEWAYWTPNGPIWLPRMAQPTFWGFFLLQGASRIVWLLIHPFSRTSKVVGLIFWSWTGPGYGPSLVFRNSLVCSKFKFSAGIQLFGMKITSHGKPDLKNSLLRSDLRLGEVQGEVRENFRPDLQCEGVFMAESWIPTVNWEMFYHYRFVQTYWIFGLLTRKKRMEPTALLHYQRAVPLVINWLLDQLDHDQNWLFSFLVNLLMVLRFQFCIYAHSSSSSPTFNARTLTHDGHVRALAEREASLRLLVC